MPRAALGDEERLRGQAERVEQLIERHAPGFRASILARRVQLPTTWNTQSQPARRGHQRRNRRPASAVVFRPVPGLGRADTPIDRRYLAGASAHPGGGVPGAPGANAARAALARNGVAGGAYAMVVRAAHRRLYA